MRARSHRCMWASTIASSAVTGLRSASVGGAAAGDVESRGGGEGALLAGQPADQRRHLVDLAQAAHGELRLHVIDLRLGKLGEDGALESRGGDAVDAHAGWGQLLAEGLGEADDARFGAGVGGGVGVAFLAGDGADVDYAAVIALEHQGHDGTAAVEDAVEVYVDYAAPLVHRVRPQSGGGAGDAGAGDEHVEPAVGAERGIRGAGHFLRICYINACGLGSGDPSGCGGERALVPVPQEDMAAFGGYARGGFAADAGRAAGDGGDALLEASGIDRHAVSSLQKRRQGMTAWRCSPSFAIPRRTVSPAARKIGSGLRPNPTPGGVPVVMMSAGSRVMN